MSAWNSTLRPGKKTNAWTKERRRLTAQFIRAGITTCELREEGCTQGMFLGFMHSKKRADIRGDELSRVALACSTCHMRWEYGPKAKMEARVEAIISQRGLL